jgi:hypothetical protein
VKANDGGTWKDEPSEFCLALEDGKINADAEVTASLFNRAAGRVKMPAVKVAHSGERDQPSLRSDRGSSPTIIEFCEVL